MKDAKSTENNNEVQKDYTKACLVEKIESVWTLSPFFEEKKIFTESETHKLMLNVLLNDIENIKKYVSRRAIRLDLGMRRKRPFLEDVLEGIESFSGIDPQHKGMYTHTDLSVELDYLTGYEPTKENLSKIDKAAGIVRQRYLTDKLIEQNKIYDKYVFLFDENMLPEKHRTITKLVNAKLVDEEYFDQITIEKDARFRKSPFTRCMTAAIKYADESIDGFNIIDAKKRINTANTCYIFKFYRMDFSEEYENKIEQASQKVPNNPDSIFK